MKRSIIGILIVALGLGSLILGLQTQPVEVSMVRVEVTTLTSLTYNVATKSVLSVATSTVSTVLSGRSEDFRFLAGESEILYKVSSWTAEENTRYYVKIECEGVSFMMLSQPDFQSWLETLIEGSRSSPQPFRTGCLDFDWERAGVYSFVFYTSYPPTAPPRFTLTVSNVQVRSEQRLLASTSTVIVEHPASRYITSKTVSEERPFDLGPIPAFIILAGIFVIVLSLAKRKPKRLVASRTALSGHCNNCGADVYPDMNFCMKCGVRIRSNPKSVGRK